MKFSEAEKALKAGNERAPEVGESNLLYSKRR